MIKQFKQVMPHKTWVIFFLIIYVLTYSADMFLAYFDEPISIEIINTRLLILLLASALYAAYRFLHFYPFNSSGYSGWLALSPWTYDKPLPFGPIHLTWIDAVIIASLTALVYLNGIISPTWPAILFLAIQSILLATALLGNKDQFCFLIVYISLLPFTIFPFCKPIVTLIVLVILYVISYTGIRQLLKNFPWNTSFWKLDPVKDLRKKAIQSRVIGFPHKTLNSNEPGPSCTFAQTLFWSALVTWYLHIIRWIIDEPYEMVFLFLLAIPVLLIRLGIYANPCCMPPISLWGRIRTFRFIIPGYDKFFLGPACIILASIVVPLSCVRMGINNTWTFEATVFIMLLLALSLPPNLKKWRLTGKYQMPLRQFRRQPQQIQRQK